MNKLFSLLLVLLIVLTSCEVKREVKIEKSDKLHKELKKENAFVHTAYFWFKETATSEQIKKFKEASESLRKIEAVKALYYGEPAATDRPVVEKSYDFAIVVHFENLLGHNVYQDHDIHQSLLKAHSGLWEKVMVTDIAPQ